MPDAVCFVWDRDAVCMLEVWQHTGVSISGGLCSQDAVHQLVQHAASKLTLTCCNCAC